LQVLEVVELAADRIGEFGLAMKLSQFSQMLA
jgi:hypothetical protein